MGNKTKVDGKNKAKRTTGKIIKRVILIILLFSILIGCIAGGIFAYKVHKNGGGLSGVLKTAVGHDEETKKNLGTINVLVLGESGVGDGYKLTDTIMVCSYNPNVQKASILSIPRDTYIGKKDKNTASANYLASYKMNAAYRNGTNIEETIECVSNVTGLDLQYYVLVDTDAVIKVVDTIGGVNFNVPIDMDYDDAAQGLHIHLKAGEQLIDGEKAEQLLRFRHNNDGTSYPEEYGDNDLGRMRTQREFLQAAASQLLQAKNILQLKELLDIAFESIKTNVDLNTIKDYIPYIVDFSTENIQTATLPGEPEKCNGIWIYTPDKVETQKIVDELFTYREEPKNIKVEVLNGTENDKILEEVSKYLTEKGYEVIGSSNTTETSKTVIINRTNKTLEEEQELKEILGVGTNQISTTEDSQVDFTIIVGGDYIK